jgi:hypothetical protein
MVGNTGRKCSSHGKNVIAGGSSQCIKESYASLPQNPANSLFEHIILWLRLLLNTISRTIGASPQNSGVI